MMVPCVTQAEEAAMAKLEPETRKVLRENPDQSFQLIVQISGEATERADSLKERGIKVRRRFRLTNSLGIQCTGDEAIRLARLSWISSMELDQPVSAFRR
jgi:hypothetical protein